MQSCKNCGHQRVNHLAEGNELCVMPLCSCNAFTLEEDDSVNHPAHYTQHPSGVECIQITEHMNFCLGNAIKYIWRAGLKDVNAIEDLEKAKWYLEREIERCRNV